MKLLQNIPIKNKLNRIILLTSTVALTLACSGFIIQNFFQLRNLETRDLTSLAQIIGKNSIGSLEFHDFSSGRETLKTLELDERIHSAGIYDNEGELFAFYQRDKSDPNSLPTKLRKDGNYFIDGKLLLFHKIGLQDERVGTIFICAELQDIINLLKQYGGIILAVFLGSLLISFLLAAKLQSTISAPVLRLTDIAQKVSRKKDYSLRAIKGEVDELGFLVDQFNEMLEQIQLRDTELSKTRDELDTRVKLRTQNLQAEIQNRKGKESLLLSQNIILEKLAARTTLTKILDTVTGEVENLLPGVKCSILLLNKQGTHLHHASFPSMPKKYIEAIDGFKVSPHHGSCGAATSTGKLVVTENIETDPLWKKFKNLPLSNGLKACWSSPITGADNKILGTFALYFDHPKAPIKDQIKLIQSFTHLVGIAIEHKKAEDQLKNYATELERSNEALKDFASIASHDLQEPLRKIILFSDRLQGTIPDLDERNHEYLERMQNAAQRMQQFINDLLLFSRVSTQCKPFQPTDFRKIVEHVIEDLDARILQTKGTITIEDLPSLEADVFQIHQLFQNLISNALKYHRKDVPPKITISSQLKSNNSWELTLIDNGIGFDEQFKDRIFKPFERLHGKSKYEGTGMGLAICKKIVDIHNGKIKVRSQPGVGTTITITLPEFQNKEEIFSFPL